MCLLYVLLLVLLGSCCSCEEQVANVFLDVTPGVALRLSSSREHPATLNIGLSLDRHVVSGRSKMQSWMLMMPMVMAGMFPYMMMGVQMLVMKAYNMSNMILMMAIMMTLRNFIFTDHFGTGVVYSNLGWREKPLPHSPGYSKRPTRSWQSKNSRRTRR